MDPQDRPRVLLCRPHGGLNDTLCRISECWTYATRFKRHLVIDTRRCSLFGPFDDYFDVADARAAVSPSLTPELRDSLNAMRCRPQCLQGRIDTSEAARVPGAGNVMDSRTGQSLRFAEAGTSDFERDYEEALLVHEGHGGGTTSAELLPHLRLSPSIQGAVRKAMESLKAPYSAIHIRNTDLRTDHRKLLRQVCRHHAAGTLLVCSDDPRAVELAKEMMPGRVTAFEGRPRSRDPAGTLHTMMSHPDPAARRHAAVDALIDLMALANAQQVFCGHTMAQRISGFSFLACHLCCNKGLVDALMGVPAGQRRASDPHAALVLDPNGGWRHRLWQANRLVSRAIARARRIRVPWRAGGR